MPVAAAISGPSGVCPNDTIRLINAIPSGVWTSSNTSVATINAAGLVTAVTGGNTTISYTVTTAFTCSVTDTMDVTVHPTPAADSITGTTGICLGYTSTLRDGAAGGVWISSDTTIATISTGGVVSGVRAGSATITYFVTGAYGCTSDTTVGITVNSAPSGTLTPTSGSATLCGGSPVTLDVTGATGVTGYQWLDGGVAISGATSASYMADSAGTYTVQLTEGSCTVTVSGSVNVVAPPAPVILHGAGNLLYTGTFASYQWYRNGAMILGATTSTYSVPEPGVYTVVVTDANGCAVTSGAYVVSPDGVATVSVNDINLYPNPARSEIRIDAPVKINITILSPDGKVVIRQDDATTVDVSNLANGMYMIMIYDTNNALIKADKFIKQD